jgi:hypothetical protein
MLPDLQRAREQAALLRYGAESSLATAERTPVQATGARWGEAVDGAMEIVAAILPRQTKAIHDACDRLAVPVEAVRGFVYPSAEFQAICVPIDEDHLAVRVSAAMCEGFDPAELGYVIGHEIGHYLLGHNVAPVHERRSLAYYSELRAREISADRLGIVAVGNVEAALRAIMKVTSGLSDAGLRFDASQYLHDAMKNIALLRDPAVAYSSHPYLPVRARCLLWFGQFINQHYPEWVTPDARADFKKLDNRVRADMDKYVEASARHMEEDACRECSSWIWLATAANDGRLTDDEQKIIAERFGPEIVAGAKRAFAGSPSSDVQSLIRERLESAARRVTQIAPGRVGELHAELSSSEQVLGVGLSASVARRVLNGVVGN